MNELNPNLNKANKAVSYTHLMQETIIKLLEAWQKKRQRDQER